MFWRDSDVERRADAVAAYKPVLLSAAERKRIDADIEEVAQRAGALADELLAIDEEAALRRVAALGETDPLFLSRLHVELLVRKPEDTRLNEEVKRRATDLQAAHDEAVEDELASAKLLDEFADKSPAQLRSAIADYLDGAAAREFYRAEIRPGQRRRRGTTLQLAAAADLANVIDAHNQYVAEGRVTSKLSREDERRIRSLLADYVRAVRVTRRRSWINATLPLLAFLLVGGAALLVGEPQDFRSTQLFPALAQVIPVLLLALAVEVGFLGDRGVTRSLTAMTVVLISAGLAATVFALFFDCPHEVAAAVAVGAVGAGLVGVAGAALSRRPSDRELLRLA